MRAIILKMRKTGIIISILIFSQLAYGQSVLDYLLQAKAMRSSGQPEQSVLILTEALAKQKDSRLLLERAEAFIIKGDYSGAIADYNSANDLTDQSGEYGLARVYALKGDAATSLYHLELSMKTGFKRSEKEILLDPSFRRIENRPEWRQFWKKDWYSVSEEKISEIEYYTSNGKIEEASAVLNDLEKSYPESATAKFAESLVDISAGRFTSSVRTLSELLASEPDNEKYLRALARAQENLDNPAGASDTYSKLLNLDIADADILKLRAECFRKTGETDKAIADIEKYLTLYPADRKALSLAGKLNASSGDNLKALKYFSDNLKNNPNDPQCYIDRAGSYFSARSWDWAVKDYTMALDLDPSNSETWLYKGIALLNSGKTEDACYDFKKSFSLGNKKATDYISRHCIR
jgi:tetratricopeptide (TPR) repeat protein